MELIPIEKARRLVGLFTQTPRVTLIQAFPTTFKRLLLCEATAYCSEEHVYRLRARPLQFYDSAHRALPKALVPKNLRQSSKGLLDAKAQLMKSHE